MATMRHAEHIADMLCLGGLRLLGALNMLLLAVFLATLVLGSQYSQKRLVGPMSAAPG